MSDFRKYYAKGDKRRKTFSHASNSVGTKLVSSFLKSSSGCHGRRTNDFSKNQALDINSSTDRWAIGVVVMPIIGIIVGVFLSSWNAFFYVGLGGAALCFVCGLISSFFDD